MADRVHTSVVVRVNPSDMERVSREEENQLFICYEAIIKDSQWDDNQNVYANTYMEKDRAGVTRLYVSVFWLPDEEEDIYD